MMTDKPQPYVFSDDDRKLLHELRHKRREKHKEAQGHAHHPKTMGDAIADGVATVMGSWRFIIIQSVLLFIWVLLNVLGWVKAWDPYPFILLNLALSFQAAYAAPIIMMSQNRQAEIDRGKAEKDYEVNLKAALEIELLHQKIDLLRETEIMKLTKTIEMLSEKLQSPQQR